MNICDYSEIPETLNSLFRTDLVRRCNWCYSIIKNIEGEEVTGPNRWCSEDCKQEENDWNFIKTLMRNRENSKKKWREKHPIVKRIRTELSRKEYLKQYFIKNRDKKKEQTRLAMKKYRTKKRLLNKIK
jgi:hypothetical protein